MFADAGREVREKMDCQSLPDKLDGDFLTLNAGAAERLNNASRQILRNFDKGMFIGHLDSAKDS